MNATKRKIIFRTDASNKIGFGHVFRLLALADILKSDFQCIFASRFFLPFLKSEILNTCNQILELPFDESHFDNFIQLLQGDEIVVLDNYFFNTEYQKEIKLKGCKLVCIDDFQTNHFVSDVVINHAPGLKKENYSVSENSDLCLGPDFMLMRKPFIEAAQQETRELKTVDTAFVCFGGVDIYNLTHKAILAFEKHEAINEINVVISSTNKHINQIENTARSSRRTIINIYKNVDAVEMVEIMKKSNMAFVPASNILLEILCIKIPVICGYYVSNQELMYQGYNQLGLIQGSGDLLKYDNFDDLIESALKKEYSGMVELQKKYIRGQSEENLKRVFKNLIANE